MIELSEKRGFGGILLYRKSYRVKKKKLKVKIHLQKKKKIVAMALALLPTTNFISRHLSTKTSKIKE